MRIFPLPAFLVACLLDEARKIAAAQQPPIARIRSQIAIAEAMGGAGDMAVGAGARRVDRGRIFAPESERSHRPDLGRAAVLARITVQLEV